MSMTDLFASVDGVDLYCGDATLLDAWRDGDVLVTDPPYGQAHLSNHAVGMYGRHANYRRPIAGDDTVTLHQWIADQWQPPRPSIIFGSWKMTPPSGTRQVLVWDKHGTGMGDVGLPWKPDHELMYVRGAGFTGDRSSSILRAFQPARLVMGRAHPTEKPVTLLEQLIAKCPPGVVVDPFAGSGSTLLAARNLGRRAIGVEIDPAYCELIVARLQQAVLV